MVLGICPPQGGTALDIDMHFENANGGASEILSSLRTPSCIAEAHPLRFGTVIREEEMVASLWLRRILLMYLVPAHKCSEPITLRAIKLLL
eukprot:scaffold463_cov92-Cylindrotheca_fusiformis.AAC.3